MKPGIDLPEIREMTDSLAWIKYLKTMPSDVRTPKCWGAE
jgi:hypothetical protein